MFEVADMMLFGRLNSPRKCPPHNDELDPQAGQAMRIIRPCETATTSTTVRDSWEQSGLWFGRRTGNHYLWVKEGKLRSTQNFRKLGNLTAQRHDCFSEGDPKSGDD
jgi:hypothetical protein